MKTIEEKAKDYDEALKAAIAAHKDEDRHLKATLERIFPELKESEDDRIRKAIVATIHLYYGESLEDEAKEMIDWLEKQGKQKSIWHNEDEEPQRDSLILLIMQSGNPIVAKIIEPNHTFNHGERWAYIDDLLEKQGSQKLANSAKTCKDEQQPTDNDMKELLRTEYEKGRADAIAKIQNPAWSEEDEEFLRRAINATKDAYPITAKWLKSLKDRYTWKPSDEQMDALHYVTNFDYGGHKATLVSLYEQLKKLKE